MKKVVFSKYSNERSVSFQIRTDILKDPDGTLTVAKVATTQEAIAHIAHNELCAKKLQESYADTKFYACPCKRVDEKTLEFDYLKGDQLDYLLDETLRNDDKEAFFELVTDYKEQMEKLACANFNVFDTNRKDSQNGDGQNGDGQNGDGQDSDTQDNGGWGQFKKVFGAHTADDKFLAILSGTKALTISNIDQIFQNIKIDGDKWFVYDYEWTFDFYVPVKYVFYRAALFYGEFDRKSYLESKAINLFDFFAITEDERQVFAEMENALQAYILGTHTRLWEMYEIIAPDNFDSIALANDEKRRRNVRKVVVRRNYADGKIAEVTMDASMDADGKSIVDIPVSSDVQTLNVVVGNDTCEVHFFNVSLCTSDGEILMADKPFLTSGNLVRPNCYQFGDGPANMFLNELPDDAILHIEYEVGFGRTDLMEMKEAQLTETETRLQAEIDALREENARLAIENEGLRTQATQYLSDYNTVVNSAAWKSTKPLRAMADMVKGKKE